MGRFGASIYERALRKTERAGLSEWRARLLGDLTGKVLEIGAGTGLNLGHYPETVTRLVLAEPDIHMRRLLEKRVATQPWLFGQISVMDTGAEYLPFPDGVFDAVVSTLVLCSVDDPPSAVSEIRRVLRPGGRLLFIEHVAAEQASRRAVWQGRIEPIWRRVAGNCHVTRDTASVIEDAGLDIEHIDYVRLPKAAPFLRPAVRGYAVRRD